MSVRRSQYELDGFYSLASSPNTSTYNADPPVGPTCTCAHGLCSYSVLLPNDLVAGCELERPLEFCLIAVTLSCP